MSTDFRRAVKSTIEEARRQGWRVELSGAGHWKFFAPNGRDIIVTGNTSRSSSGFSNFMARMRRAGFQEER